MIYLAIHPSFCSSILLSFHPSIIQEWLRNFIKGLEFQSVCPGNCLNMMQQHLLEQLKWDNTYINMLMLSGHLYSE